jgi:CubicO group peptidase (beta-lactamase class C family)
VVSTRQPQGRCAPRFERVREAFAHTLAQPGELGGGVCVTHRGEVVVDLVGGVADAADGRPWQPDTVAMVWSCTKGATALCAHLLVAVGELELDAPVARWWPQFAADGKGDITVAMLLSHQAGLPGVREQLAAGEVLDDVAMAERMARERPLWVPGSRHGYHSFTFGWLVGELVRRVTGMSVGEVLRRHVAEPLGADVWIGLPEAEEARVARVTYGAPPALESPFRRALARGEPIQAAMDRSWGELRDPAFCARRAVRAAQIPAINGVASARGLALLYRPLATDGRVGDLQLPARLRERIGAVASASSRDAVVLAPSRFGLGFQKAPLPRGVGPAVDWEEPAFGHGGYGGSVALADPRRELSLAYVTNRHVYGADENARAQALVDATYASMT